MNTRNTEAIEALHAGIQYLVDKSIASAPFDKIKNGKIIDHILYILFVKIHIPNVHT